LNNARTAKAAVAELEASGERLSSLVEELTGESLTYATPAIFERRRSLLRAASKMLATKGFHGFTVKDVCVEAGVSPYTLYKAFESKERLVAVALATRFRAFHERTSTLFPAATLDGVVCRLIYSDRALIEDSATTKAVIAIHYSPSVDESVRRVCREKGRLIYSPWANALFRQGQLRRGVNPAELTEDLTSVLFAVCWDWARGAFDDEAFLQRKLKVMLAFMAGVTRGAAQAEITALLTDLLGPQKRLQELRQLSVSNWLAERDAGKGSLSRIGF